ncbi:MAG TPA: tetratricopeptide repeat protein, partial [Candidatus Saccharimonadales bacterium]|nr:tetratricopeptide repeat protein [Candidatus Saccharimonadales bacterium]
MLRRSPAPNEKVETHELYSSLYRSYAREPFGTVRVRNLDDTPITARLKVFIPDLMTNPSEQDIVLRPNATQEVALTAVLPDRVVDRTGDRTVQVQVSTTYQSLRLPRTEKASARCVAYGPGAIDWSKGMAQAAAFVTTRDPAVESLAREAVRAVDPARVSSGNRNVDFTAAIFDAVATLGVTYVADPNNPYATISGKSEAVDTILYPRQTLEKRTGDCDDTTVLLAALLGNVGIRTKFVDVPGHIFLLVGADLHERNRFALGAEENQYVILDDEVWIPLETTALRQGFAEAWRIGAEEYASWSARGHAQVVDVDAAQARYQPGTLSTPASTPSLDSAALQGTLIKDLSQVAGRRQAYLASHYEDTRSQMGQTSAGMNELALVYYSAGRLDEAKTALHQALEREPRSARTRNNLGVVEAAGGDLEDAAAQFQSAVDTQGDEAGYWLNLGLARYAAGDSLAAEAPLSRGLELSGGYEKACALLGLAPEGGASVEGGKRMTAEEARDLLKAALRRVPRPVSTTPARTPRPPKKWSGRVAGGRSAEKTDMSELLYWKR